MMRSRKKTTEEDLEKNQPYLHHNLPSPTMNSGLMDVYHSNT